MGSEPVGDPNDDTNPKKWLFGDRIENDAASYDNPTRIGYFVRRAVRSGRINAGPYVQITDGRGNFWECPADREHRLTRIEFSKLNDQMLTDAGVRNI
jgi:hypothetical protein